MITKKAFGLGATLYTLSNGCGMQADVTDYGATLVSLRVPGREKTVDAVLGYENAEGYRDGDNYLGATVSRYGNRIAESRFTLNGREYRVNANEGRHCLHGGSDYHLRLWDTEIRGEKLVFRMVSPDGDFGFPGELKMQVTYWLDAENGLHLAYEVQSDRETVCNLTNHTYFNLNGNRRDVLDHELYLNAESYTQTDAELIPVGNVPVAGTEFDFRTPRKIGRAIYDHSFNLSGGGSAQARLYDAESGVEMAMFTDRPAVQVYDSVSLPVQPGKHGTMHGIGAGIALETQVSPNALNRRECETDRPLFTVSPERPWRSETVYRFSVR